MQVASAPLADGPGWRAASVLAAWFVAEQGQVASVLRETLAFARRGGATTGWESESRELLAAVLEELDADPAARVEETERAARVSVCLDLLRHLSRAREPGEATAPLAR